MKKKEIVASHISYSYQTSRRITEIARAGENVHTETQLDNSWEALTRERIFHNSISYSSVNSPLYV